METKLSESKAAIDEVPTLSLIVLCVFNGCLYMVYRFELNWIEPFFTVFNSVLQEKKRVRKALESRKVMQGKLDVYEKR